MKRWLLHFGVPIGVGLFMGFALRWTWLQCLTLPISLVMFAHWFSRRTGGEAYEALDSLKVSLLLTGGLVLLTWLAFWVWERPHTFGFRSLGPEPGPKPIPFFDWGHPRIISYLIALAPGLLYISERVGHYLSPLQSDSPSS